MKYLLSALIGLVLATTQVAAQSGYRIKSGDTIAIEVLEDTQLNRQALVLPGGTIDFPFVGTVRVAGRTATQVQSSIAAGISSQFANTPTVFVSVSQLRPIVPAGPVTPAEPVTIDIFFTGEVTAPGTKQVAPGTTFLQAMAQSGGFSNFAATKRVQLRRTDPTTGQQTTQIINYKALSRGARLSNEIYVQEGDVILVPERRLFE